MSRAVAILAIALAACCLFVIADAEVERVPDIIDGTGLIDFGGEPNFKVGDWVRYHTVGSSQQGYKDDYVVTLIVAGEEMWWGEPCFWLETWTEKPGQTLRPTASLVSYAAFGDTMAFRHFLWFMRKTIDGLKAEGHPDVVLYSRERGEFRLRKAAWDSDVETMVKLDTLGTETVTIPAGTYETTKVLHARGHTETAERGDSTIYYERRQEQTFYMSRQVPITCLVKIEVDDIQRGKSWLAGQFNRGPFNVLERTQGSTTLVEMGHGGLKPRLVPEAWQYAIADRRLVQQATSLPSEPAVRSIKGIRRSR